MLQSEIVTLVLQALGSSVWETLQDRLFKAKKQYAERLEIIDDSYERKRGDLLRRVNLLQSEIIISYEKDLYDKLFPRLSQLLIELYEAFTDQELSLIELKIERIEGALQVDKESKKRRVFAQRAAVIVSFFFLGLLGSLIYWSSLPNGPQDNYIIPIVQIPLPIVVWSAIGSFSAILYRFNYSGDTELEDPLRWLFTRPLTGIVMGIIAYFVFKVGFLSFSLNSDIDYGKLEILWLIAFIGGFSDRFADTILRLLIGKFGGDSDANILNVENLSTSSLKSSLQFLLENFPESKINQDKKTTEIDNKKSQKENNKNIEVNKIAVFKTLPKDLTFTYEKVTNSWG